jgi:nitrate reductase gamma subunit
VTENNKSLAEEVEIRRAPKIVPFMLTGVVLGLVIAFIVFLLIPASQRSNENILGLLLLSLGSLFGGLGVAFSIGLDLLTARRAKRATAERVVS